MLFSFRTCHNSHAVSDLELTQLSTLELPQLIFRTNQSRLFLLGRAKLLLINMQSNIRVGTILIVRMGKNRGF